MLASWTKYILLNNAVCPFLGRYPHRRIILEDHLEENSDNSKEIVTKITVEIELSVEREPISFTKLKSIDSACKAASEPLVDFLRKHSDEKKLDKQKKKSTNPAKKPKSVVLSSDATELDKRIQEALDATSSEDSSPDDIIDIEAEAEASQEFWRENTRSNTPKHSGKEVTMS